MANSENVLPDAVVAFLTGGQSVVLATVAAEGYPITTIMTWVVALDNHRVAFAVDQRGRALGNIRANGKVALEILGDDITIGCRGQARVVNEAMSSPPFPSAKVVVTIEEVRNHASPGVVFKGPSYTFAADKVHRSTVERGIFAELRAP